MFNQSLLSLGASLNCSRAYEIVASWQDLIVPATCLTDHVHLVSVAFVTVSEGHEVSQAKQCQMRWVSSRGTLAINIFVAELQYLMLKERAMDEEPCMP